jgi:hypothetical protein
MNNLAYYPAANVGWPDGKLYGRRFDLGQFAWLTACSRFVTYTSPATSPVIRL